MRRVSIAALMLVVLVCAVAVAALRQASDAWAGGLLMLTLAVLGSAVFGAVYRREGRRAFWLGFAAFGWGYLALAMGPWFAEQVAPKLPTTLLLNYAHACAHPEPPDAAYWLLSRRLSTRQAGSPNPRGLALALGDGTTGSRPAPLSLSLGLAVTGPTNLEQFARIGHCLFALVAAVAGGLIARGFQRTNQDARESG